LMSAIGDFICKIIQSDHHCRGAASRVPPQTRFRTALEELEVICVAPLQKKTASRGAQYRRANCTVSRLGRSTPRKPAIPKLIAPYRRRQLLRHVIRELSNLPHIFGNLVEMASPDIGLASIHIRSLLAALAVAGKLSRHAFGCFGRPDPLLCLAADGPIVGIGWGKLRSRIEGCPNGAWRGRLEDCEIARWQIYPGWLQKVIRSNRH